MNKRFGEHLMIDGYKGDFHRLWDRDLVYKCLKDLPEMNDMHPISEIDLVKAEPNGKDDCGGWSAMVMIAESHISVHTFPAKGFVSMDVYTCKAGLDVGMITNYFKAVFDLKDMEVNLVVRGTRFPEKNIYDEETGAPLEGN